MDLFRQNEAFADILFLHCHIVWEGTFYTVIWARLVMKESEMALNLNKRS